MLKTIKVSENICITENTDNGLFTVYVHQQKVSDHYTLSTANSAAQNYKKVIQILNSHV